MNKNYNIVDEIDLKDENPVGETKKVEPRADFRQTTVIELYKSVGGLCSKCKRYTIARNPETGKYVSIGEAAHIFGARRSKQSPRPNYDLTDEELRDFNNGIWLCRNCHRQVDYDQGFFSSDDLLDMKKSAEKLAYDLLNKDIQTIVPINYEKLDLSILSPFQKALIHFELKKYGKVSFDLADNFWDFENELFNEKRYNRLIPFKKGSRDFDWNDCWDIFLKIGFGECDESYFRIVSEKLWLQIYKDYSFLLKNPELEKEIANSIPDILKLTYKDAEDIVYEKLSKFEVHLSKIVDDFIDILEKNVNI